MDRLLKEIEKTRIDLYELTKRRSLTDGDVILLSQKLNDLLNQYSKLAEDERIKE